MKNNGKVLSIIIAVLLIILFKGVAFAADDANGFMNDDGGFETRVLKKIDAIFPEDKDLFHLEIDDTQKGVVAIYGNGFGEYIPLTCKQNVLITIDAGGQFVVGVCSDEHLALVKSFLKGAPDKIEAILTELARNRSAENGGPVNVKDLEKKFLPEKKTLKDGSQLYYLPVLVLAHGSNILPTVFLIRPDNHAVIVQADIQFCDPARRSASHPLCKDTKGELSKLVQGLEN